MFQTTVADLEALNNMTANQLQAGQTIRVRNRVPAPTEAQTSQQAQPQRQAAATSTAAATTVSHRVESGDSLHRLASRFNVSVQEISLANNFPQDRQLRVGEVIQIPTRN